MAKSFGYMQKGKSCQLSVHQYLSVVFLVSLSGLEDRVAHPALCRIRFVCKSQFNLHDAFASSIGFAGAAKEF